MEEMVDQLAVHVNLLTKQARWQAELVLVETFKNKTLRRQHQRLLNLLIRSIKYLQSLRNSRS
jgi:hypothetical protein